MSPETVGWAVFALYLVIMIVVGLVSGRYQKTSTDYWVAGRRFGTAVMVMGIMASIMHGGSILSGLAFVASFGAVAALPFMSFALGFLIILMFFARKLREAGGFTLPDYMGERFDSTTLRAFSACVVAASSVLYLVAQIRGMGLILEKLLGLSFVPAMAVGTALFVFYVALGGMLAVIWTNIAQFIFMWTGLLLILPAVYAAVGGASSAVERVEAIAPGWTSVAGTNWSLGYLVSWWLVWLVAYASRVELVTKVLIARDAKVARYAIPTSCLLVMIFLFYGCVYLGAAARLLVWEGLRTPDEAFPALVAALVGPVTAAITLTGIASAAMSTTDSLLLLTGAAVAHDLLRKSFYEPRGIVKTERYYLVVSRLTVLAIGLISFVAALNTPALILAIVSYALAMVGGTFFFPLLFGLASPKITPAAALASSVGGFVTTSVWTAFTLAQAPWALAVHPILPGLAVAFVLIVGLTPLTAPAPAAAVARYFPDEHAADAPTPEGRRVSPAPG